LWTGTRIGAAINSGVGWLTGGLSVGALIYDWCNDEEDEINRQEWLDDLNAGWALLSIQSRGPFDKLADKELHDRSVDLFCTQCPDLCNQAGDLER
jgi:hypothetical protein